MSKHTLPPGYAVNRDGTVVSTIPWRGTSVRILAQNPDRDGYMTIRVRLEKGTRRKLRVHRLVAAYWLEPCPTEQHEVRHLDGDKLNNHVSNLAWGTRAENAADRERHGRTSRGAAHSKAIKESNQAEGTREFRRARKETQHV